MLRLLVSLIVRSLSAAGRGLSSGSASTRVASLAALTVLVVAATSSATPAMRALAPLVLPAAFLIAIYSLVIRGR